LTSDILGIGITESRTYSNDSLLPAINYSNDSLGNLTYTWDTNKNKKSESIGGVMSGFGFTNAGTTYDDEDRITGYQRINGALSQSWNLTAVGDWNSVRTSGIGFQRFQPVLPNRTHGPTHELLNAGGKSVNTSAGDIAERYAYSAYGEPTICDGSGSELASSSINNRYSYTGREWDATVGLYHFRARRMCGSPTCSQALRGIDNNNHGIGDSSIRRGSECSDCVNAVRNGNLATNPELLDPVNSDPRCKDIPAPFFPKSGVVYE
jgi:hypothetical protein